MSPLHLALAACFLAVSLMLAMNYLRTKNRLYLLAAVFFLIPAGLQVYLALPMGARPQLDVKNVCANPTLLRHDSGELIVSPGGTGHFRYSPGDSLTIFAGGTDAGKSKSITLPSADGAGQQRGPGNSPRISAEVNADNPDKIEIQFPK
jgi:hypothetical protein